MRSIAILLILLLPETAARATLFQLTFTNEASPVTFSGPVPTGFDVNDVTVGFSFDNGGTSGINQSGTFADIAGAFIQSGTYSTFWSTSTPGWSNAIFTAFGTDANGFLTTNGTKLIDIRVNSGEDGLTGFASPNITITGPDRVANANTFSITFSNGTVASPLISHNGGTSAVAVPEASSFLALALIAIGYGTKRSRR